MSVWKALLQRDQIAKMVTASVFRMDPTIDYCQGEAPFPDVPLDSWAASYICFAKAHEIITGYTGEEDKGLFKPSQIITRAELVAILSRALPDMAAKATDKSYNDIFAGPWYVQPASSRFFEVGHISSGA